MSKKGIHALNFHTVALLSAPYTTLTYARPSYLPDAVAWRAGMRVLAPLGSNMVRVGVLLDDGGLESGLGAEVKVRPLIWPLDAEPLLDGVYLELVRQLALRQMVPPGHILGTMLPAGLRSVQGKLRVQRERAKPRLVGARELLTGRDGDLQELGELWRGGKTAWLLPRVDAAASEQCVLLREPPWNVRPTAKRQTAVLEYLLEHGAVMRRDLQQRLQGTLGAGVLPALEALVKAGLVGIRTPEEDVEDNAAEKTALELLPPSPPLSFELSGQQAEAVKRFTAALDAPEPVNGLLFGVTGSGKTAVYMELARACLERGRSVFLLAPEVALALKLRRDVGEALAVPVVFYHGYQSPQHRERVFAELAELAGQKGPRLVVGTRSALFLPVSDPALIILDEEHDASFKQDEGLTYQAKEVAWFRVMQSKGLLVLGSATPDLKTFHAARESRIEVAALPSRVGEGVLPEVRLVDIRETRLDESPLAPESLAAIKETVKAGDQVVILLNRRGYAPVMYCLDCGKAARCPHCDIGLTYHKHRERLVCHYCGYALPFPSVCPTCKGLHYHPMGQGTERLEEFLEEKLPSGTGVLRLDRDSTRCPGRMEHILEEFAAQKAQVLVGTQMLSKGHHFPHVTLAVVADGDMGLNIPDYRATERTFQLLVQSSGRAGRGEKPGQVIIQTRDVRHACWDFVKSGDYEGFYAHEIELRRKRRYPPFVRLALLRISFPVDWKEGAAALEKLGKALREAARPLGVTALGPAPAPLAMLRGRRRFQCLLKAPAWGEIREVYAALLRAKVPSSMRVALDIDPVNML